MFLGRVDKEADQLALLGFIKSEKEVNQHVVRNLIQSKSILGHPIIPRSEIDAVIHDAHLNDKFE